MGNCATAGPVDGNQVDTQAPTVTITTPPEGATYTQNQSVAALYACSDGAGSDVASCTAPAVETSILGAHSFTVDAADNVGNASSTTTHYSVVAAPAVTAGTIEAEGQIARNTTFKLQATCTKARGELRFTDKTGRHSFKAAKITAVICNGDRSATIAGTGSDNGGPQVPFTVKLKDGGSKRNGSTFSIAFGGYTAAGPVSDGSVSVRIAAST